MGLAGSLDWVIIVFSGCLAFLYEWRHFETLSQFLIRCSKVRFRRWFYRTGMVEDLWNGNDYHPPCNLVPGGCLLDIYMAGKNIHKLGKAL